MPYEEDFSEGADVKPPEGVFIPLWRLSTFNLSKEKGGGNMKKIILAIILSVAVIVITEMPCQAQGKLIYGCYGDKSGNLRIVGNLNECKKNEVPISWSSAPRTGYVSVYGSAFLPTNSSVAYNSTAYFGVGRYIASGPGQAALVAPLTLPDGVTVTDVSCTVLARNPLYDVIIGMNQYHSGYAPEFFGEITISGGVSPDPQKISIPIPPEVNRVIDNSYGPYALSFESDYLCGADCRIFSCIITYTP